MTRICSWCGEAELLDIAEVWHDHHFTLETCCGARHEQLVAEMADDPQWATDLLRHLGAEEMIGCRLRRLYDDHFNTPVLDYRLDVQPISFAAMSGFVRQYHRHCEAPITWRFGAAIHNGWTRIGVVSIGNPVARAYMTRGWVEVNRLCVRADTAPQLAWNACSQLYGYAAREAERRGYNKIITYIREDEPGTSLKAAGWTCEGRAGGRGWNRPGRARSNRNAWIAKTRWSRILKPRAARQPLVATMTEPTSYWSTPDQDRRILA